MKKATFGGVTKQKTPSKQNCSTVVFVSIFVNRLLVERNYSLTSGNRKDLKCVVCGPWSVVSGLSSVSIDSHVCTLLRKCCTVLFY